MNMMEQVTKSSGRIGSPHAAQNTVAAALHRNMEVSGKNRAQKRKFGDCPVEMHRFDTAQANPPQPGNFNNFSKEIHQAHVAFGFLTEGAEINACKHNFLKTANNKRLNFCENIFRMGAAPWPAHLRNDAIGASGIAAVLKLYQWARLASCVRHRRQGTPALLVEQCADHFAG